MVTPDNSSLPIHNISILVIHVPAIASRHLYPKSMELYSNLIIINYQKYLFH
jgi:hypothetical protein